MNKKELITAAAKRSGMTQADTERAINALVGAIEETMASGESVKLPGFGNFIVRERAARTGRNPKTAETIEIPASKTPVFKASKALKEKVN